MDKFNGSDKEILQDLILVVEVLKDQVSSLKEPLHKLVETVQVGNGKNSLLTRAALIEDDIEDLKEKINKLEEDKNAKSSAHTTGRYLLYAALATGSFGSIVSIIELMIKFFKN